MGIYGNLQYSRLTQFRSLNFPEHKQRAKCHRERERERKRLVIPRAKVGQREKFRESVWCDTNLPWIKFRGYYNCSCCWHVPKFRFSPFSSFAPFAFAFAVIALLLRRRWTRKIRREKHHSGIIIIVMETKRREKKRGGMQQARTGLEQSVCTRGHFAIWILQRVPMNLFDISGQNPPPPLSPAEWIRLISWSWCRFVRFSGISARWNTRYPIGNGGYVPGSARNWTALRVPQILYGLGLRSKKSAVEKLKGFHR